MKVFPMILLTLMLCISITSIAASKEVRGSHSELGCSECHGTDSPTKSASQKACKSCHGDMTDSPVITFKDEYDKSYTVSPHDSHAGQLRCTLCHSAHKATQLYCNDGCHHTFKLIVP